MKIICLQEKLKKALSLISKITGKNPNLPILNNILIETDKGRLRVSATDLEIGMNIWISAKVEKSGKATVPASILSSFISSLPSDKVRLSTEKYNLIAQEGSYKAEIKGLNPADFPIIPQSKEKPFLFIKAKDLQNGLSQVYQAASFSDTRPEISGVFFQVTKENTLKLVATDSFRLAEKTIKKIKGTQQERSFILPIKTTVELIRTLSESDAEVKIGIEGNQVFFDINDIYLTSRLIEGHFPDYERIIPTEFKTDVTVDKDKLLEAIKIASLFVSKINDITFNFSSKGKIEIISSSQEIGSNNSAIKAEVRGEDLSLTFNYRYIIDGLSNIEGKKILLRMNGKEKPLLMKEVSSTDYFYIVMPVRETE